MGWRERSKESVKQLCLTSSNEIIEHLITIDIVKEEMSRVWKRGELMEIQSVAQKYDNTLKINWTHKDRTQNK